jgi:hypothetical protein
MKYEFTLDFDLSAAMCNEDGGYDLYAVGEAVEKVAEMLKRDNTAGYVRDLNGNTVGSFSVHTNSWEE